VPILPKNLGVLTLLLKQLIKEIKYYLLSEKEMTMDKISLLMLEKLLLYSLVPLLNITQSED
jgi:hypothetical protein